MKKQLFTLLCVSILSLGMIISGGLIYASSAAEIDCPGDINGDGVLDIIDVSSLLNMLSIGEHEHTYREQTTEASCTVDGYTVCKCTICGHGTLLSYTSATGHIEERTPAVLPTCTTSGLTEGRHCSLCGEIFLPQTVIPATGHANSAIDPATPPTCTEPGLTEGRHCNICGEVLTEQMMVPALGHSFENGKCTLCNKSDPQLSDAEYFAHTLFIGDSRTVGMYYYGKVPGATYFARTSMSVNSVFNGKVSETDDTAAYTLEQLLTVRQFDKIYILLGINEIGMSYDWIIKYYSKVITTIQSDQPNAKIIIQSNMHVTKEKSDANPDTFSNTRINELNRRLSLLADNEKIYYLSFEHIYDDADGNMSETHSRDGVHLYSKSYTLWKDWICKNGRVD